MAIEVYRNLLAKAKKQHQQLPITMFLVKKKRQETAPPPPPEGEPDERSAEVVPSEQQ